MKIKPLIISVLLLAGSTSQAMVVSLNSRHDQLTLKDGRILTDLTLKTYDNLTGKVLAQAPGKLLTLAISDLPDDIAGQIMAKAPGPSPEEIAANQRRAQAEQQAARERAAALERRALADTQADRNAQRARSISQTTAEQKKQDTLETRVAQSAKNLARHYFLYEADPNSNRGYTFNSDIQLDTPEPVPGWTDRWRVQGKVGIQYLTSNIGAVGRSSKEFEILLDVPAKGKPKLADITVK